MTLDQVTGLLEISVFIKGPDDEWALYPVCIRADTIIRIFPIVSEPEILSLGGKCIIETPSSRFAVKETFSEMKNVMQFCILKTQSTLDFTAAIKNAGKEHQEVMDQLKQIVSNTTVHK